MSAWLIGTVLALIVPCAHGGAVAARDAQAAQVTLGSLLAEFADPLVHARGGGESWTPFLVTSRDPASTDPRDPARWFSENDAGFAVRFERVGDRNEWILADVQGPGAITRIVLPFEPSVADATIRVRIDGAAEPVLAIPLAETAGPTPPFPRPFCETIGIARDGALDTGALTLRLPVPFAARCTVSLDRRPAAY
ncbi:MAG: hypothetical protein ACO3QC_10770, partial [Phycisphaerales bacterium]